MYVQPLGIEYSGHVMCSYMILETDDEKVDLQASPVLLRTRKESQAPIFTKELDDTTCYFNNTLTLICNVTGVPRPQVRWYR